MGRATIYLSGLKEEKKYTSSLNNYPIVTLISNLYKAYLSRKGDTSKRGRPQGGQQMRPHTIEVGRLDEEMDTMTEVSSMLTTLASPNLVVHLVMRTWVTSNTTTRAGQKVN